MEFYPAIDLKDGKFVRLLKGDMDSATIYGDDPAAQALAFDAAGCNWLHVVDLDGASSGKPANAEAVEAILAATDIHVQLGGGVRDRATIESWLDKGVSRIVLGTAAVKNPNLVREACLYNADKIAVGIDARGGKVAVEGWSETSDLTAATLAERFEDVGVAAIIYTDIDRDGAMTGPNIEATIALAETVTIPVIASGGVSSMADLQALKEAGVGLLDGVIAGRALYDGSIDPADAVALLSDEVREV